MNFIEKISRGARDDLVHLQFQKFSRGEFRERAGIRAKFSGGKYTIFTSPEFGNELVREVAVKLGDSKTNVTGAIVSTADLTGKINFKEKKQFQGVKRYLLDGEMSGKEILNLLNEFPKAFFGLSFSAENGETTLKIKPKAPKSGKPSPKGSEEGPKIDFCKLITKDATLARGFVYEKPDFKEAEIRHTFVIEDMVIPEALKKEKDFAKVREGALRKGKIIRESTIDGVKVRKELGFEA